MQKLVKKYRFEKKTMISTALFLRMQKRIEIIFSKDFYFQRSGHVKIKKKVREV